MRFGAPLEKQGPGIGAVDEWRFIDTLARDVDPDGTGKIPKGSTLYVRGWGLLPEPARLAKAIVVSVGPDFAFDAVYGKLRIDIEHLFETKAVGPCGFVAIQRLAGIDLGPREFVVAALDENAGYFELARQRFEVISSRGLLEGKTPAPGGRMHVAIDDVAAVRGTGSYDGKTLHARVGDVVYVRGWAVDMAEQTGLRGAIGIIDDDEFVVGVHGLPRLDAANAISMPKARRCGFTLRMPTRKMKPGSHTLDVAVLAADGTHMLRHRVAKLELV